MNVIYS